MLIGVPKETKDHESRVALPPTAVAELVAAGHHLLVAEGAGLGSGFADAEYVAAGADAVSQEAAFEAELVLKVKEPLADEIELFSAGQTLFTFLHLAGDRQLATGLLNTGVTAIAYEAVQTDDGRLPILIPMSEVAGALAVTVGAGLLQRRYGGRGVLVPSISGVPGAKVTVLGAGVVGGASVRVACGMGARVTVLDRNQAALDGLSECFPNINTVLSDDASLAAAVADADLLVGAVLIPGAKAPRLVSREMVRAMVAGSVIVDVAIDQGGCVEGIRTTSHSEPSYVEDGVVHCAIPNLPGVVPLTSTLALAAASMPYVRQLAELGWKKAVQTPPLRAGLRMTGGYMTHRGIADTFALPYNSEL